MERKDNPAFEYAAAVTPAPEPQADDADCRTALGEAARMMRVAMRMLVSASDGDPLNLWYAVQRAAGMSLSEIGAAAGISKQAVFKRLSRMCRDFPAASAYLGVPAQLDEAIAGDGEAISIMMEHERRRRRLSLCLTKESES